MSRTPRKIRPLLIRNARVLRCDADRSRGADPDLRPLEGTDVLINNGQIQSIGTGLQRPSDAAAIDAEGRALLPGFIDPHTHLCWAGERLDEWARKQAGATYLEILASGGGIMSTVRAVRESTKEELADRLLERLDRVLFEGTTTIEIKSGYGLSTEAELKMLEAIELAASAWPGTVVATACIGHALDPDMDHGAFIDRMIGETLPAVHERFGPVAIDAYCEEGALSFEDSVRLFDAAQQLGHPCRVHADQFNELGLTAEAVARGFASVDHLEATTPEALRLLAESDTSGVMLPCSGFHLDDRYADGRGFLDAGGRLVLGSNANPGSSPCSNIPMTIALATRKLGITTAEAIYATTRNAADLLSFDDRGQIAVGMRADLVLLRSTDERSLGFEFGGNPVQAVVCGGELVGFE